MDLWQTLTYDSSVWSLIYDPTTFHSMWVPNIGADWGWSNRSITGYISYSTEVHQCNQSGSSHITTRTNYVYHDSNGTTHPFGGAGPAVYWNECTNSGRIGFTAANATDQSGYQLTIASTYFMEATVTFNGITIANLTQVDGTSAFNALGGSITDTNGNVGPDTLGTGGSEWTYPSPTNPANLVGVTVNSTQYSVKTNFACGATWEFGPLNVYLITSVVMADGSSYTITYEQTPGSPGNVTGRIASIHLPSGGTINYSYSGGSNGIVCGEGSPAILQRTTPDGTWTYNRSVSIPYLGYGQYGQPPGPVTTTITDPLLNITVVNSVIGFVGQFELKRQIYQGSTTLLQTVETCYNGAAFPCTTATGYPITRKTVRLEIPNSAGLVSQTDTTYSSAGLVTDVKEYDFGSGGPPATPVRTTHTDYAVLGNGILNRPSAVTVKDGSGNIKAQTTYAYDQTAVTPTTGTPNHVSVSGSRGNPTTITYLVQGTTTVSQTKTYYDTGNPLVERDFAGNPTTYAYGTASCGNSFPTQITDALGHNTSMVWDCYGAVKTSVTDPNQKQTTFTYGDPNFWRLTQTNYPDGGSATTTYNLGVVTPWNIVSTSLINATQTLNKTTFYDSLGRVTQAQTAAPGGPVLVDTTYDALGRVHSVSNPHYSTSSPTDGITTYVYDALNRTCVAVPPDGTAVSGSACPATQPTNDVFTTYSANTTTVKDQAGKSRKSVSDGLGRLSQVFEDPAGSNYETDYQYDTLSNLTRVDQKGNDPNSANWRTRTFTYNSRSQLLTASNPESGTITYTYDSNGNVQTKVAPAPNQTGTATVTTTFTYDVLNRITQKSYSDGTTPTVKYGYDAVAPTGCTLPTLTINNGIGKRTGMCDAAGAEAWSYDITANVGWKLTDKRTTNGVTKSTIVQNNLAGSAATLTYPSGRIITYAFDAAARPVSAIDSTGPINYATAASYAPPGALSSLNNGASIVSTYFYNNRLQPCRISVKSSGTAPASCTDATAGNVLDFNYNFSLGTANNGNVAAITSNRDPLRSQSFAYDALNRLATAQTNATFATGPSKCWGEQFSYDPWANFLSITGSGSPYTGCTQEGLSTTATAKNQISGFCYDAAGNLLAQSAPPCPSPTYTYNAENQMTLTGGVTYTYDGDGRRVKKSTGKLYWYGMGGDPLDETDAAGNTNNTSFKEYIFFGGQRIARRDSSNTVNYYFADHLGTARIVANSSGTVLDDSDFYPFGGERNYLNSSPQNYKFTGKERDSESGLDNFGARYFGSSLGRFMSPDPPLLDQHIADPQSWNLYSYVRNNPLSFVDPTGNAVELLCSGSDASKCAAERQKELEFLQKSLGNDKAASNLYINEVKDGDTTRYFVGIKGDVGDFMKMGETSHDLANLVENKNVVEFGLTSKDLSNQGGAVTYEKGEVGNQNVRVLVNPKQADVANTVLSPNTILGASRWGGQNKDPRWRVSPFTGEVMAWHELGHAWGYINGRPLDRTNPEANAWENRMREQLYGPIGPNNAPRVAH